jgi:TPR repeat protein
VEQSFAEAYNWYDKALTEIEKPGAQEKGYDDFVHGSCYVQLGRSYLDGDFYGESDPFEAMQYLLKAREHFMDAFDEGDAFAEGQLRWTLDLMRACVAAISEALETEEASA